MAPGAPASSPPRPDCASSRREGARPPGGRGSRRRSGSRQRLARLGVADVVVLADGDCASQLTALAEGLSGRTLIVDADLIVADACLGQLVDDPAVRSGALVGEVRPGGAGPGGRRRTGPGHARRDRRAVGRMPPPVRVAQKRIASAGSTVHDVSAPNRLARGVGRRRPRRSSGRELCAGSP